MSSPRKVVKINNKRKAISVDLHCHILPGIDDGAPDISVSLEMARASLSSREHSKASLASV